MQSSKNLLLTSIFSSFDAIIKKYAIFIFFILGLLIYGNSLLNSYIADDFGQVKENVTIRSVFNIPGQFIRSTFYQGNTQVDSDAPFYRPVQSSVYSLIYLFSREYPFGFHLTQILVHITNSILIFFLFSHFF